MAEQPITHARFAEIVAYMSSHCAQWAGSCLTLPEKVSEPMTAWSLKRFIDEMQQRIDYLREDLDTTGAAEIRARSALENGPAGLADANSKDAISAKDRELAEALAAKDGAYSERNQCVALIARFALSYGCRVGIAKTAIEGWDEAWHGCVYIDLPTGQVSWHYHDSEAHLFDFLPPYLGAWDGHTTLEKYERVSATFPIRPTETERERDEAMAALREKEEDERQFLEWAMNTLHEINVSNYDHDEVCRLNERSVEVILAIRSRMEPSTQNIGKNVSEDGQPVSGSREQRGNEEG